MLQARDVTFSYADSTILDRVSLSVERGEFVGLIGPSGSGKTTLARLLSGRLAPLLGEVTADGQPVPMGRDARRRNIALISQSPRDACNPRWTLGEIIGEPLRISGLRDANTLRARIVSAAESASLSEQLLSRRPGQVSDGQLQRACVARAMVADPSYLICDEPTSMLDPIATAKIVSMLRQTVGQGRGVLLISHDHRLLRACVDRVEVLGEIKNKKVERSGNNFA